MCPVTCLLQKPVQHSIGIWSATIYFAISWGEETELINKHPAAYRWLASYDVIFLLYGPPDSLIRTLSLNLHSWSWAFTGRTVSNEVWTGQHSIDEWIPSAYTTWCNTTETEAFHWEVPGFKRGPGTNWRSTVNKDLFRMGITWEEAEVAAQNIAYQNDVGVCRPNGCGLNQGVKVHLSVCDWRVRDIGCQTKPSTLRVSYWGAVLGF